MGNNKVVEKIAQSLSAIMSSKLNDMVAKINEQVIKINELEERINKLELCSDCSKPEITE